MLEYPGRESQINLTSAKLQCVSNLKAVFGQGIPRKPLSISLVKIEKVQSTKCIFK